MAIEVTKTCRFPDEHEIRNFLLGCRSLNLQPYYNEKGITGAISDLAAKRFANTERYFGGVRGVLSRIIVDLTRGEDAQGNPVERINFPEIPGLTLVLVNSVAAELQREYAR